MGIFSTSIDVKIEIIDIEYDAVTIKVDKQLCDGPHILENSIRRITIKIGEIVTL